MNRQNLAVPGAAMHGISNINIVLGRNGAGKSRFFRALEGGLKTDPAFYVRYVSPERAGVFREDGNIQNNIGSNKNWLGDVRRKNQADNFKAASAVLLREVEVMYLRKLQGVNATDRSFQVDRLEYINRLLSNISIQQEGAGFVFRSSDGVVVNPDQISSGESEAVALATEIVYFFDTIRPAEFNVLFLDEPDVHLHPDLQARLANLVIGEMQRVPEAVRANVAVCIATHSTPLICAFASSEFTTIGTKDFGVEAVNQASAKDQLKKVAPFFGHPLSLSLSDDVILILEGEDDERVWQQAARSSLGRIRLFPVLASSVDAQSELEQFCAPLLSSLYDNPVAYSLRDGDGIQSDLSPTGPIVRFRLHCYAIENALLSDDCLKVLGTTWDGFRGAAGVWLEKNPEHKDIQLIQELVASEDRLRYVKIKAIRQLVVSIADSAKPWEVVVGQAIGRMKQVSVPVSPESLHDYLGENAVTQLVRPTG